MLAELQKLYTYQNQTWKISKRIFLFIYSALNEFLKSTTWRLGQMNLNENFNFKFWQFFIPTEIFMFLKKQSSVLKASIKFYFTDF